MHFVRDLPNRLIGMFAHKKTYWIIMAFFLFESSWIAISSRYPMAFDEQQHFGVIRLHAASWFPFLQDSSADTARYGAIARDPSFLYHYLMSFPYRLIAHFTSRQAVQVIGLRFIDIGLVIAGLMVFRRVLTRLRVTTLRQNIIFFCLVLLPVFPLLAGQVTYDDLMFLMVALALLFGVRFMQAYRLDGKIDAASMVWLVVIGLLGSTVKYAFLPIFAATILYVGAVCVRHRTACYAALRGWWKSVSRWHKSCLIALFIVGGVLFSGSYGVNVVRYRTPLPSCSTVLSVDACLQYAPWARNYHYAQKHPTTSIMHLPAYVVSWVTQMVHETFFEIGSSFNQQGAVSYYAKKPLKVLLAVGWTLLAIGTIGILLNVRHIWRNQVYRFVFFVFLLYLVALFGEEFHGYMYTGVSVAIHGRYLIPIIVPIIAIAGDGVVRTTGQLLRLVRLSGYRVQVYRNIAVVLVMVCWLQGGLVSYLLAFDDRWLWSDQSFIIAANHAGHAFMQFLVA